MASEEDNFDIDVYGDGGDEFTQDPANGAEDELTYQQIDGSVDDLPPPIKAEDSDAPPKGDDNTGPDLQETTKTETAQKIASTDESAVQTVALPKQAPQTQGVKRKEGDADDRYVDPAATTALFVSELHWWITDDDIRGWANQAQCEDELEDITFNEHKVNGKSKG